jgi:hypothetical protein
LAPGVRWYLKPYTGDMLALVLGQTSGFMASVVAGRASMIEMGFDTDLGVLTEVNDIASLSILASAVFAAKALLLDWEGFADAEGQKIAHDEEGAIAAALRYGPPGGGQPILEAFLAWMDKPRRPINADCRRLRELAEYEFKGGGTHCEGCAQEGAACVMGGVAEGHGGTVCPRIEHAPQSAEGVAAWKACQAQGVWRRSDTSGALMGLDFAQALAWTRAQDVHDDGAVFRCLLAIEVGALAGDRIRTKVN